MFEFVLNICLTLVNLGFNPTGGILSTGILSVNFVLMRLAYFLPQYINFDEAVAGLRWAWVDDAGQIFVGLGQLTQIYTPGPLFILVDSIIFGLNFVRVASFTLNNRVGRAIAYMVGTSLILYSIIMGFVFWVLVLNWAAALFIVTGFLTMSLKLLSAALLAILLTFFIFYVIIKMIFICKTYMEIISIMTNGRDEYASITLLSLELLLITLNTLVVYTAGIDVIAPQQIEHLILGVTRVSYLSGLIAHGFKYVVRPFVFLLALPFILINKVLFFNYFGFIAKVVITIADASYLAFWNYIIWVSTMPYWAAWFLLLPLNMTSHLIFGQPFIRVFEFDNDTTAYSLIFVRLFVFVFVFISTLLLQVLFNFVGLILICLILFWALVNLYTFIVVIGGFKHDLFTLAAYHLFALLPQLFTFGMRGIPVGRLYSVKQILPVSVMRYALNMVLIAYHYMGYEDFVLAYRFNGSYHSINLRDDIPEDPEHVRAIFTAHTRRFNVVILDLIILIATVFSILLFVVFLIRKSIKITLTLIRELVISLIFAFICAFLPNIWYEFLIGFGWMQFNLFKAFIVNLDFNNLYITLRFFRSLIRFCGLQGWFLMGYMHIQGLEAEQQARLEAIGEQNISKAFIRTYTSIVRSTIKRFVLKVEDFRLPEFIQAQYQSPTVQSIRTTYRTLQDLGFPIDEGFINSISAPNNDPYLNDWASLKAHIVAQTDFRFAIPRLRVGIAEEMRDFGFPEFPGAIHTSTYSSEYAELESTNRYFEEKPNVFLAMDEISDVIDAAWDHVKVQYGNSKLASPWFIYKYWVKKYNMGFGFTYVNARGKTRQMKRAHVIAEMGGKAKFLRAWSNLFKVASGLVGISPVFTKMETLKLKKAINRLVRTVTGSSPLHAVLSYVFAFKPNHNYHPWENSSKVGMPINGTAFSRMFASFLKHDYVWAGDMQKFDSSIPPAIVRIVRDLRKKGYEHHQDSQRLYELIDIAYEHLIHQPLGFKSMGTIFEKERGFSTGHTSTTPDNTLALLICYLLAWRDVTGLRAREFFNYNTLANFGDDHILAYDKVFAWTPQAAAKAMEKLGIIMRDEGEGQDSLPNSRTPRNGRDAKISFLSKLPLYISGDVLEDLKLAGIDQPLQFAVCHDRERLLTKIKGQVDLTRGPIYRRDRLISYLYLTSHHRDIYDRLRSTLKRLDDRNSMLYKRSGVKLTPIPDYKVVLRKWYNTNDQASILADELDLKVDPDTLEFTLFEAQTPLDVLVRWLSDFPTLLSPRYANTRWADWIQQKGSKFFSWPLALIGHSNGTMLDVPLLRELASRTPYNFLRNPSISPYTYQGNTTTLYVRHWIFMAYISIFMRLRNTVSFLDMIRLFDHAFVNSMFILTAKVVPILVELDLHIFDLAVLCILSYLHVPEFRFIDYLLNVRFDAPSTLLGGLITGIIAYFSPNGSVDFQPLTAALRNLNARSSFVLSAPTGVGKSTRMVHHIQTTTNRRVIVIEPRHLLVTSIVDYMNILYPSFGIGGSTEGMSPAVDDKIIYCTAQSFLLSPNLRNPRNLFIIDEAHVNEPSYSLLIRYLQFQNLFFIASTATPRVEWGLDVLEVPSVSSFKKEIVRLETQDAQTYLREVAGFVNRRGPFERQLIFVNSLNEAHRLTSMLSARVTILSSGSKFVDPQATVFVATSVADAGITIPDVSIVHTMDVGITVVLPGVFQNAQPTYYRLDDNTLTQRSGRTGRTSNGVVFQYHLLGGYGQILDQVPVFTALDYINGVGSPITVFFHLLPIAIQEELRLNFAEFSSASNRVALNSLKQATFSEFDLSFGLNSEALLSSLTPAFIRGFRNAFDNLGEDGLHVWFPGSEDIGLYGDNFSLEEESDEEVFPPPPTSLEVLPPSPLSPASSIFIPDEAGPQTNFDPLPTTILVPNLVALKYFGGVMPSQEGLGPASLDLPDPEESDSSSSDEESPEIVPGFVDDDGVPHAHAEFETPRTWDSLEDYYSEQFRTLIELGRAAADTLFIRNQGHILRFNFTEAQNFINSFFLGTDLPMTIEDLHYELTNDLRYFNLYVLWQSNNDAVDLLTPDLQSLVAEYMN